MLTLYGSFYLKLANLPNTGTKLLFDVLKINIFSQILLKQKLFLFENLKIKYISFMTKKFKLYF